MAIEKVRPIDRILEIFYSFAAVPVLLGALFKITHTSPIGSPNGWLYLGLGTEALVFTSFGLLYIFRPPQAVDEMGLSIGDLILGNAAANAGGGGGGNVVGGGNIEGTVAGRKTARGGSGGGGTIIIGGGGNSGGGNYSGEIPVGGKPARGGSGTVVIGGGGGYSGGGSAGGGYVAGGGSGNAGNSGGGYVGGGNAGGGYAAGGGSGNAGSGGGGYVGGGNTGGGYAAGGGSGNAGNGGGGYVGGGNAGGGFVGGGYVGGQPTPLNVINDMLNNASITPESLDKLSFGFKTLEASIERISAVSNSITNTQEYNQKLQEAIIALNSVNNFYHKIAETSQTMVNSAEDARRTQEQLGTLAQNLARLNQVYAGMLTAMQGGNKPF